MSIIHHVHFHFPCKITHCPSPCLPPSHQIYVQVTMSTVGYGDIYCMTTLGRAFQVTKFCTFFDALSTFTFTYKVMFITFTLYFFTFQVLFSLLPSRCSSSLWAWLSLPLPSLRSLSCSGRGANMEEPSRTREGGSYIQFCFKYLQKYLLCFSNT